MPAGEALALGRTDCGAVGAVIVAKSSSGRSGRTAARTSGTTTSVGPPVAGGASAAPAVPGRFRQGGENGTIQRPSDAGPAAGAGDAAGVDDAPAATRRRAAGDARRQAA